MNTYSSGQLAAQAGVNAETIRYYEKRRLLTPSGRRTSGYRIYTDDDIARLQFIRSAKQLGFTLREIQSLLALSDDPSTRCADMKRLAADKINQINARVAELQVMKTELENLVARDCQPKVHPKSCSAGPVWPAINDSQ